MRDGDGNSGATVGEGARMTLRMIDTFSGIGVPLARVLELDRQLNGNHW